MKTFGSWLYWKVEVGIVASCNPRLDDVGNVTKGGLTILSKELLFDVSKLLISELMVKGMVVEICDC